MASPSMVRIGLPAAAPTRVMHERTRLAVEQDGAGPALALAAAVLGPGQTEVVAQDAEQAALGVRLDGRSGAVDE